MQLAIYINCNAQQLAQSPDERLYGNVPYTFVGKIKSTNIICMQISDMYVVKKYNDNMGELSTMDLPSLPKNCKQLQFVKSDTNFIAIYETEKNNFSNFYTQVFDTSFHLIQPEKLFINNYFENATPISIVFSENKKRVAMYCINHTNEGGFANYLITDNNFTKTNWKSIAIGEIKNSENIQLFLPNTSNTALLTLTTLNADNLIENLSLTQVFTNDTNTIVTTINQNNKKYNYLLAQMDNKNNDIVFCMTHAATNADDKNLILKTTYHLNEKKLDTIHNITLQNFASKKNNVEAYANYLPRQIILKSNGEFLLISEFFDLSEVTLGTDFNSNIPNGAPMRISRVLKKYDYSDIMLLNINNTDSIVWQKLIHKEQISENDDGQYSSFATIVLKNNLAFVFNALDKNTTIQQATISPIGNADYAILNDAKLDAKNAIFKKAKQISYNEILVPCQRQNIVSFVKIKY